MINDQKCKKCRRAGEKLFLKGERCFTPKCAIERKPYPPGRLLSEKKHRSSVTEYGIQMREKQKVRNTYRVSEKQFGNYIKEASGKQGANPAENLFEALESRLDNSVFRAGFAASRSLARQMVAHGHITVNGRRTDIPSRRLVVGDVLAVRPGSKDSKLFETLAEKLKTLTVPTWFKVDAEKMTVTFQGKPKVAQGNNTFNLTSVIEFYSR
ncbi:MAG: 30S ribosomal protein S4 [Candidatus Yonathbacteria bacterium RIFCSPLOWO2_01_FULL_47_33b]|uniref:Small ribosomal subunit protein uS4 n=1 Tax=Candidatus Yonathbacteria bacterium RIFCSPLOWO2_01_FULL_47_33b TaxID=1802727 RepID=A0A1G2SD77_9BACT|nr:MAG: 30S ribosomal protein S4 [Candidatus Yonathbacteria bacterium RIFCSPLOWO2_01_FULL_47_33b]